VIENLCDNAIKYGDAREPITVSLSQDKSSIHLAVHNSGKALSADEQAKIFRPFLRTASAQKGNQLGWGIGLTFVRDVAEAHGGTVEVRSTGSEGTTFTVSIPRRR
jgi:signal transduction histidine kinase